MGGDDAQRPAPAFDVRIERTARFAPAEGQVDRAHVLDRVAGEDRIAESARRRVQRRPDGDLPVGRHVDVGREVMPAGATQRYFLQGDDIGLEFTQDPSHALRIVAAVRPDALVDIPGRDLHGRPESLPCIVLVLAIVREPLGAARVRERSNTWRRSKISACVRKTPRE